MVVVVGSPLFDVAWAGLVGSQCVVVDSLAFVGNHQVVLRVGVVGAGVAEESTCSVLKIYI